MDDVLYSNTSGILSISINRPEQRNALNGPVVEALGGLFQRAGGDPRP